MGIFLGGSFWGGWDCKMRRFRNGRMEVVVGGVTIHFLLMECRWKEGGVGVVAMGDIVDNSHPRDGTTLIFRHPDPNNNHSNNNSRDNNSNNIKSYNNNKSNNNTSFNNNNSYNNNKTLIYKVQVSVSSDNNKVESLPATAVMVPQD